MTSENWYKLGPVDDYKGVTLKEVKISSKLTIVLSYHNEKFGAISNVCNHVGGPLGKGRLDDDGDYVICPWHNWKFHRVTGFGEPGFEDDRVPQYRLKIDDNILFIDLNPVTTRNKKPHPSHLLSRDNTRKEGPIRIVGISTTVMDKDNPRYSTSEKLLKIALDHAKNELKCETFKV